VSTVAFGPYRLEPDGRLRRGSEDVHLPPKEAALLAALIRTAGALVSKRELLATVWPGENVLEGSLTRCISAVRRALGDAGRRGRFIETVHGRGYRFVVRVREQREEGPAPPPLLRLAVVPFENGTGDDAWAAACEELADEISSALARLQPHGVGVLAPRGVGQRGGTGVRRADLLVTGCVRLLGGRLRLRTELVRASDQLQLAAHAFDCDASRAARGLESLADAAARDLHADLRRTLAGRSRRAAQAQPARTLSQGQRVTSRTSANTAR